MNYSLLALTMAVAYLLFAVGSHLPEAAAPAAADSAQAKRVKPAEELRILPRRRG